MDNALDLRNEPGWIATPTGSVKLFNATENFALYLALQADSGQITIQEDNLCSVFQNAERLEQQ